MGAEYESAARANIARVSMEVSALNILECF